MNTTTPIRIIDGAVLPAPGIWEMDPSHTDVSFTGRHLMVAKVRGRFTGVAGTVVVTEGLHDSRVHVTIDMASVDSGNVARDEHLRSAELFAVERFPTATYRGVRVVWDGNRGVVDGELTLHGVTRQVQLRVTFEGHARDPWGAERAAFSATTTVNREDFGITWNVPLEAGGVLVSKHITIDIDIEAVLRS